MLETYSEAALQNGGNDLSGSCVDEIVETRLEGADSPEALLHKWALSQLDWRRVITKDAPTVILPYDDLLVLCPCFKNIAIALLTSPSRKFLNLPPFKFLANGEPSNEDPEKVGHAVENSI